MVSESWGILITYGSAMIYPVRSLPTYNREGR
jgi:hypothetical protein